MNIGSKIIFNEAPITTFIILTFEKPCVVIKAFNPKVIITNIVPIAYMFIQSKPYLIVFSLAPNEYSSGSLKTSKTIVNMIEAIMVREVQLPKISVEDFLTMDLRK